MYLGFYNFYRSYNRNRMFTDPASPIGDDLGYPTFYLAQKLKEHGHQIATIDMDDLEKFDAVVFLDYPTKLNSYFQKLLRKNFQNIYLFLLESPAIRPDNWNKKKSRTVPKGFHLEPRSGRWKKIFPILFAEQIAWADGLRAFNHAKILLHYRQP